MNVRVIVATVPMAFAAAGVFGIVTGAGFGWPLAIIGGMLFVGSLVL